MKYLDGLIFILIVANLILAGYLSYAKLTGTEQFCLTGKGCSTVQNSGYAQILGIPIAYMGITSFVFLLLIYLLTYKKIIKYRYFLLVSVLGSLFALYFFYLQAIAIKAFCSNCLATEAIMFLTTILGFCNVKNL